MQNSIKNVSGVVNTPSVVTVAFNGNRMVISAKIPRVFDCDRNTAQGLMDTSLSQLTSSLVEAVDTYVASGVQFVKHDSLPLTDMGQQKVSEGERTCVKDKDLVLFYVNAPKRLTRCGYDDEDAPIALREQMIEVRNRIMVTVRGYWTHAMNKVKKAKNSVKESEAAMTA